MNEIVQKISYLWLLLPLMMIQEVRAECTPTPDCASMGYTETSCDGKYVRCPFDTSKLFCAPCDSTYQYSCSEANMASGVGASCNNKYISCKCAKGYNFINGLCECDTSCKVGNIYYSDGTCSYCVDSTKTAIGVIIKDNELVLSKLSSSTIKWATSYADVAGISNISTSDGALNDFNGKANTIAIAATYTSNTSSNNAGVYCNSYSTEGTNAGDWYLPAFGEFYTYAYGNWSHYSEINATLGRLGTPLSDRYMWTSTEFRADMAWFIRTVNGAAYNDGKDLRSLSVACFLDIKISE